jgi:large subunit ribosomal protein L21
VSAARGVESPFVPEPSGSLTAVVVSGGKQYRVAPGDRILVDRLKAEPGAELTLDRVLLVADGTTTRVGLQELQGHSVQARVIGHRRGPKIDVLRYKSKKRVRVHRGARADLTALQIVGITGAEEPARAEKAEKAAKADKPEKPARTRAPKKTAAQAPAEGSAEDS